MRVPRRVAVIALLVVSVVAGGACGSSDSGMSSKARQELQVRVVAIRDAAAEGDRDNAETRLDEMQVAVVNLRGSDDLNDAAVTRILSALEEVEKNMSLLSPEPSETTPTTSDTTTTLETTTTTASTTTTTPPPDRPGKGKGKGGKGD